MLEVGIEGQRSMARAVPLGVRSWDQGSEVNGRSSRVGGQRLDGCVGLRGSAGSWKVKKGDQSGCWLEAGGQELESRIEVTGSEFSTYQGSEVRRNDPN